MSPPPHASRSDSRWDHPAAREDGDTQTAPDRGLDELVDVLGRALARQADRTASKLKT